MIVHCNQIFSQVFFCWFYNINPGFFTFTLWINCCEPPWGVYSYFITSHTMNWNQYVINSYPFSVSQEILKIFINKEMIFLIETLPMFYPKCYFQNCELIKINLCCQLRNFLQFSHKCASSLKREFSDFLFISVIHLSVSSFPLYTMLDVILLVNNIFRIKLILINIDISNIFRIY